MTFLLFAFTNLVYADYIAGLFPLSPAGQKKCPKILSVKEKDGELNISSGYPCEPDVNCSTAPYFFHYRGSINFEKAAIAKKYCWINTANSSVPFDFDRKVCSLDIIRGAVFEKFTCWSGTLLFGAGSGCRNPQKAARRGRKKSYHIRLDYSEEGILRYNASRENGVNNLPDCTYDTTSPLENL